MVSTVNGLVERGKLSHLNWIEVDAKEFYHNKVILRKFYIWFCFIMATIQNIIFDTHITIHGNNIKLNT